MYLTDRIIFQWILILLAGTDLVGVQNLQKKHNILMVLLIMLFLASLNDFIYTD